MSPRYNLRNRNKIHDTSASATNPGTIHEELDLRESFVYLNVRRSKRKAKGHKIPKSNTGNNLGFILKRLGLCPATPKHAPSRPNKHLKIKSTNSDQQAPSVDSIHSPFEQITSTTPEIACLSVNRVKGVEVCSDMPDGHTSCEVPQAQMHPESPLQAQIHPESPLVHDEIHTKTPESTPEIQQENAFNENVDCVFRRPLPIQSPFVRDRIVSQTCPSSARYNQSSESPRLPSFRTPLQSPISKLPNHSSEFTIPSPVVLWSSPCLRTPHLFRVPSSPAVNHVHSTPDLPCLMLTPNLGLGSASQITNASPSVLHTPSLPNQWDSPCVPKEVMSTPFLMKTIAADCPDLINMIDDELGSVQAFDRSLRLYDNIDLTDMDVADYVSSLSESFAETLTEFVSNQHSPAIQQKVVQAHAQGRYGKLMTKEMVEAVKAEQKRREKIRKDSKKEESKDPSYDARRFQQTISKDGRRTRAILRKCDELGISLPEVCLQKDEE